MAGQTIDRQCASGLMAIAIAAKQIIVDGMEAVVGGGQENISALNTPFFEWVMRDKDPNVVAQSEHAYMSMLDTAEFVASRYEISREAQDRYALSSQAAHGGGADGRPFRCRDRPDHGTAVVARQGDGPSQRRSP